MSSEMNNRKISKFVKQSFLDFFINKQLCSATVFQCQLKYGCTFFNRTIQIIQTGGGTKARTKYDTIIAGSGVIADCRDQVARLIFGHSQACICQYRNKA